MSLVAELRRATGRTQAELARLFDVSQPAISQYESGKRSPRVDRFAAVAGELGRMLTLVPDRVDEPIDPSARFSRLLHVRVAEHLARDPERVRRIGREFLAEHGHLAPPEYRRRWEELLEPEHEIDLLVLLCVPDREATGLLASSPFAGVLSDEERLDLLRASRADES